jgi:hypothetical protein
MQKYMQGGKQMHSRQRQGCIQRHEGRSWQAKVGRQAAKQRQASRWADAGMKKEVCMQAIIDSDMQAGMDEKW